jgi:hypothetical protein
MPAQLVQGRALLQLKGKIARVRARSEHLQMIAEHSHGFVAEARLAAVWCGKM